MEGALECTEEVIIWASGSELIHDCECAVCEALKELGIKAVVLINAEPPLIARNQLWDRLPVVEVRGRRWSLRPGEPFTKEQLVGLFSRVLVSEDAGGTPSGHTGGSPQ